MYVGGNTFTLKKYLWKSGFDKVILNYIDNGVTYLGASAGTHILTKNIEHVKYFDTEIEPVEEYSGLGVFDGIIICHYNKEREKIYNLIKKHTNYKITTLKDREYLIFDGVKWKKYSN